MSICLRGNGGQVFGQERGCHCEKRRPRPNHYADVYAGLLKKLRKFHTGENLTFDEITYLFLKKLEIAHYANDNETGGLSVYTMS